MCVSSSVKCFYYFALIKARLNQAISGGVKSCLELAQSWHHLPARKVGFAEAQNFAVFPRRDATSLLGVLVHGEALGLLEGPGALALGRVGQAHLLHVEGEHWKLRFGQAS